MSFPNRRMFLGACGLALWTPGVFAEQLLLPSPALTEGPFYPDRLPLDSDNDLIIARDNTTPAVGTITHLTGRILSASGEPLNNTTIEIWQCDANAVYLHSADSGPKASQQDENFQGYGKFTTGSTGEYRFRTIKPVPYPGRPAPHIHVKISQGDRYLLTTQIFMRGFAGNLQDGVFLGAGDLIDRELASADFKAVPDSQLNELACNHNLIIGRTPSDEQLQRRR